MFARMRDVVVDASIERLAQSNERPTDTSVRRKSKTLKGQNAKGLHDPYMVWKCVDPVQEQGERVCRVHVDCKDVHLIFQAGGRVMQK